MRHAQQKQRQAIDKYNREVRAYNQKLNRAIHHWLKEIAPSPELQGKFPPTPTPTTLPSRQ